MDQHSMKDYEWAGCQLDAALLPLLWGATKGRICDTGCVHLLIGCKAYDKLLTKEIQNTQFFKTISKQKITFVNETVRDEAKRLGISISEVRKNRRIKNS
jgi:hypothetical protein